ncbi:MAG TPA: DUF58 domain-containing protein [Chloroflexota bacterium]|nr:DUF58 domain-containing protein [Chloroflexota bacterium]
MFGPAALALLCLLLVVGVATRQEPLTLFALALVLAALVSQLWRRYCLTGVEYRRRLDRRRVAFGETLQMEVEVVNRKLLPLAWLRIFDELPDGARPARGRVYSSHRAGRLVLDAVLAMRPFERVRRFHPIPCHQRGGFEVGPVRLSSGDLFGLVTRETELDDRESFVVWPRVVPLADPDLPARQPLGELKSRSWLFEDPARIAGAREFRPGDPTRRVHWPASVRTQRLLAKVYEPTTSRRLVLALNLNPSESWTFEDYDAEVVEFTIMVAASAACWALEQGYEVGLVANGIHRNGDLGVVVAASAGPAQRERVLDALGKLQAVAVQPFERTLEDAVRTLRFGTSVVLVSAALGTKAAAQVEALHRKGHALALLHTGPGRVAARSLPRGVVVRRAAGGHRTWRDMSTVDLVGVR